MVRLVIWDAIVPIVTSLSCNKMHFYVSLKLKTKTHKGVNIYTVHLYEVNTHFIKWKFVWWNGAYHLVAIAVVTILIPYHVVKPLELIARSVDEIRGCHIPQLHWNGNVFILMKFSSLAALEVVKMTTSSAASD